MIWMSWSWKYDEVEKSLAAEIFAPFTFGSSLGEGEGNWGPLWEMGWAPSMMNESQGILGEGTSQIIFRCPATWLDNWRRALESLEDHRWFSGFLESRMCTYTFPFYPPKKWFIVENPSINGWFGGAPWIGNLWKPQHLHGPKKATTEVFQGRPEGNHRSSRRNRRRCGEWTDLSHGLKMLKMCIYMH